MKQEKFLKSFLAETPEDAEEIYNKFSVTLNKLANSYSLSTGLEKADLFSEALVGLARAVRDFDSERSVNFESFAMFKIKDALNIYVNKNMSIVKVPTYIKRAHNNVSKLRRCLLSNNIEEDTVEYTNILLHGADKKCCQRFIDNIKNAADRLGMSYNDLVMCSINLPVVTDLKTNLGITEELKLKIIELKLGLNELEKVVVDGLLEDKSFRQIGAESGKSASWAYKIFINIKQKLSN